MKKLIIASLTMSSILLSYTNVAFANIPQSSTDKREGCEEEKKKKCIDWHHGKFGKVTEKHRIHCDKVVWKKCKFG